DAASVEEDAPVAETEPEAAPLAQPEPAPVEEPISVADAAPDAAARVEEPKPAPLNPEPEPAVAETAEPPPPEATGPDVNRRELVPRPPRRPMLPTPVATELDPLVRAGSAGLRLVVNAIVRLHVEGDLAAIPREGPLIVAANHAS